MLLGDSLAVPGVRILKAVPEEAQRVRVEQVKSESTRYFAVVRDAAVVARLK